MSLALDLFSIFAIGAGVFFFFAGTVALVRFPDLLSRLHALTKADNLGFGVRGAGTSAARRDPLAALKLVVLWAIVQLSSATVGQMIGGALRRRDAIE